ncbi:succinyl-CoA synthetase (ADP-forming) beta subunit [Volucribacter psittacicida]|uniref:Succinate--CoA ligase [ADP-forming] subunit beta n=1 Tax=Volucribacter psittacicida TaxID=203482 RepID=A0A4R1GCC0_9PAST|nr:ADP-forming succinate--CoA ligase subunit beta [Volucribacter psittacicida]TCK01982.1 succinyl-CoA synthetase (ADP-forming) beta subunit [Volucribacter psittacicida]
MNLHEYQSKQLFAEYGLPIPKGIACYSEEEAIQAMNQLGGEKWVAKCQIHGGGRGKAGGVQLVHNKTEMASFVQKWLGQSLVTFQTDSQGQPVHCIYVEQYSDIHQELYLSAIIDRSLQKLVFMVSAQGGMNIEDVAEKTPHLLHKVAIDPSLGAMPYQGRELAFKLGLQGEQLKQFVQLFLKLAKLFIEKDIALLEINPLGITQSGQLLCLDAKVVVDSNALYRQPELAQMQDKSQEDPRESLAEFFQLNYVALTGNIGCMVNGAGLAMATMDIIKLYGGEPANFLDVGGGATKERVAEAFKIILSDKAVKAVLVNIFGGIVRCDLIAEGIIAAVDEVGVNVPVVVRLEGTNAQLGREILATSKLNIIAAQGLAEAAQQVVAALEEK